MRPGAHRGGVGLAGGLAERGGGGRGGDEQGGESEEAFGGHEGGSQKMTSERSDRFWVMIMRGWVLRESLEG